MSYLLNQKSLIPRELGIFLFSLISLFGDRGASFVYSVILGLAEMLGLF
jgi:hypothetical protein